MNLRSGLRRIRQKNWQVSSC